MKTYLLRNANPVQRQPRPVPAATTAAIIGRPLQTPTGPVLFIGLDVPKMAGEGQKSRFGAVVDVWRLGDNSGLVLNCPQLAGFDPPGDALKCLQGGLKRFQEWGKRRNSSGERP